MNISDYLLEKNIPFEENVLLSKKTWIKTGGLCTYWITPESRDQLVEICRFLYRESIAFDVVGQTSNIFFHSTYNPRVVVSTVRVNQFKIEDNILVCECGCNVMKLAKEMLAEGYAGFYGLVGLPGTIASAAVNNAGCFSCSISSMLTFAEVLTPDGMVKTFTKKDFRYKKRSSSCKRGECKGLLLSVKLELQRADDIEEEKRKSEETKLYRKNYQEGPAQNLGSVFASMSLKKNIKNRIAVIMARMAGITGKANYRFVLKRMLLFLYGYTDLNTYISDRQINTFVWRDAIAEQKFVLYKEFMSKVYCGLKLEIEEKQ